MAYCKLTVFLVTGEPGIGKTTLVRKVGAKMRSLCKVQGFCTVAAMENDQRIGFDVVTLNDQRAPLARLNEGSRKGPKVGKHSLDLESFERLVLPLLTTPSYCKQLIIIDGLGTMELKSKRFQEAVQMLLRSKRPILVTLPSNTNENFPLVKLLKSHGQTLLYKITPSNRDELVHEISEDIMDSIVN